MHSLKHFVHKIRDSEAGKRFSDHHGWYILIAFIVINFVFGYFYLNTRNSEQLIQGLWEEGSYEKIAKENNTWGSVGLLKLGDIEQSRLRLLAEPNAKIDESILPIKKAFFLESKGDIIGAEQLLSFETSNDPAIRALYLALRSYYFCLQKKYLECAILAEDSVKLDPLAALGLQMTGIANASKRNFVAAKEAFGRAEKLGGLCTSSICLYNRGLMHFYTAQYSGAISDLSLLTSNELIGNDALLFLGRTSYNKQDWTGATMLFNELGEKKGGGDWVSQLWLARIQNAQGNTAKALEISQKIYATGGYGIEVLTDMMQYADALGNNELLDQLITQSELAIGNSPFSHLIVVRALRSLNYLDLAEQYQKIGLEYAGLLEDEQQRDQYISDFLREGYQLGVHRFFEALQNDQPTEQIISALQMQDDEPQQTIFLQGLKEMVQNNVPILSTGLQTIPALLQENERIYVLIWRDLLNEKPIEALERLIRELPGLDNTPKHLWVKRAVTKRLGQTKLAQGYIDQLISDKVFLPTDILQNEERLLWKQAFLSFHPWLSWMYPYLSPDRFWEEDVNSF